MALLLVLSGVSFTRQSEAQNVPLPNKGWPDDLALPDQILNPMNPFSRLGGLLDDGWGGDDVEDPEGAVTHFGEELGLITPSFTNSGKLHLFSGRWVFIRKVQPHAAVYLSLEPLAEALNVNTLTNNHIEEITLRMKHSNKLIYTSRIFHEDTAMIEILPDRHFRPGLYTITVNAKHPHTGEMQRFEQDFAWGVLAMNPDKDRYMVNETAALQFGVLDQNGKIVCDAELRMDITTPTGNVVHFSTLDQSIQVTGTCGRKEAGFIEPDYVASLPLPDTGTYNYKLTAITDNGAWSTASTIEVVSQAPFMMKRTAATRLWPFAPSTMNLKVHFSRDFTGTISDTVPEGFVILDSQPHSERILIEDEHGRGTRINWQGAWEAGETAEFLYTYDAPDISPEFYLIGPATLTETNGNMLQELRSWQIANDANENPLQDAGAECNTLYTSDYNMGYQFTPDVNGQVTQLGLMGASAEARTVRLFLQSDGSLLASVSVTGAGAGTWVYEDITPVNLTADVAYVVAARSSGGTQWCYDSSFSTPTTQGNVSIDNTLYITASDNMPSTPGTTVQYGLADVTFVAGGGGAESAADSWLTGWDYRKKITIDNTNVDSNLTDFPLYVKVDSDTDIGANALGTGYDIRFTSATGATLSYERESFSVDGGAATGHFWVKVPDVSSSSTTDIYLYYGNADAADGEDATNTWNSNYTAVWHSGESSGSLSDSSGNSHHGTFAGTLPDQLKAKIGNGQRFNNTSDYLNLPYTAIDTLTKSTVSTWVYLTAQYGDAVISGASSGCDNCYLWYWASATAVSLYSPAIDAFTTGDLRSAWHHLTAVYDTIANTKKFYVDGSLITTKNRTMSAHNVDSGGFIFGQEQDSVGNGFSAAQAFQGYMDELRVYNGTLSDNWIKFEFNNINEADQELAWSAEETWLSGWDYRKKITIDYDQVDSDLTDFPLYVKIDADTDIGDNALSTGYDLRFTSERVGIGTLLGKSANGE